MLILAAWCIFGRCHGGWLVQLHCHHCVPLIRHSSLHLQTSMSQSRHRLYMNGYTVSGQGRREDWCLDIGWDWTGDLPGVRSLNLSPLLTSREHFDPRLMVRPSLWMIRFIPVSPGPPPDSPNGAMALLSDRMDTFIGLKNSICSCQDRSTNFFAVQDTGTPE